MRLKRTLAVVVAVIGVALAGFYVYVQVQTYPAEPGYLAAVQAEEDISIAEKNDWFVITPGSVDPDNRPIIYYPGGLVSPEAYLYKMGMAATRLQAVVYIIKSPFNAAIFKVGAAGQIIDRYDIDRAWVGGHSLGGIAASRFVATNPDHVHGLFLLGSYSDRDLTHFSGPVVSVMGLSDQIINRSNYEAAKANLPKAAVIREVETLNHSDFGNYGLQAGDGESGLGNEQVIDIIVSVFE